MRLFVCRVLGDGGAGDRMEEAVVAVRWKSWEVAVRTAAPAVPNDPSNHFRTFCAFCTQPKGTNGEGHKTASPSTLSKQNFYATSFCLPSAIPKACCSNVYQSAGCRNARQRRNARLPSNNAKHISHQRPSPTTSHHLLRRLRKRRSIPISNLAARPKNLTNCFSSTPGRLQMTREPYV